MANITLVALLNSTYTTHSLPIKDFNNNLTLFLEQMNVHQQADLTRLNFLAKHSLCDTNLCFL